jgi:hypothetical protein
LIEESFFAEHCYLWRMEFTIHTSGGVEIARLNGNSVQVTCVEDAVDLLGNASFQGATKVVVRAEQLHPDFFELRTGLAGEVLQKFSNYRMKLAIIGEFGDVSSKSLRDFIRESNRTGHIFFVESLEEALSLLQA